VRRFVSEFYQRFLGDPDGTSRVALATHELLENAVKYSRDGETTIRIGVDTGESKTVTIHLSNRADETHIAAIREILDGVASEPDAVSYYQKLIASKAKRKDSSGQGLARICAEGEMTVTYTITDTDRLTLEASTTVGRA